MFSEAQMRTTLAQVRATLDSMQPGFKGALVTTTTEAISPAVEGTARYLREMDRAFKGVGTQPLAIDTAAMLDTAKMGTEASVLRRIAADPNNPGRPGVIERYGSAVIGNFETALQQRFLQRQPWEVARQALISESPFLQGAPAHWAERVVRTECLLGDTRVTGAVVRAVTRRWYEGRVVEVVTDNGRQFAATPNHPMLTTRGWVGAGELRECDNLICYRGEQDASIAGDCDVQAPPATMREIFDSVAEAATRSERRRGVEVDFHGDGGNGDVDVASAHRKLGVGRFAALHKPLAECFLTPADRARTAFCHQCARLLSVDSQECICQPTARNAGRIEAADDGGVADAEGGGEGLRRFTGEVAPSDFGDGEPAPRGARFGDVRIDRVRSVTQREHSGHVYNLHTDHGYFVIDGAYTGNTMAASNRASWESIQQVQATDGQMVKLLAATFDDRTGADSWAVHGQIRRVSEAFESWFGLYQAPPNRPNDREIVAPHNTRWPIPKYLEWKTDGEVAQRWREQKRKGSPPPRPKMTTVPLTEFPKG
jgi:hypothetical protein